jgi:hypothetical protein
MTTIHQFSHSATRSRESAARCYALSDQLALCQAQADTALAEAKRVREGETEPHDLFPLYVATFCSVALSILVLFS